MSCNKVRRLLSVFVAGELPPEQRSEVAAHVQICRECGRRADEFTELLYKVRCLQPVSAPAELTADLRILASQHRSQRVNGRGAWDRLQLVMRNMMRPLMVPAAGGLMASIALFTMLVDTLVVTPDFSNDVPIGLFTKVTLDTPSPFEFKGPNDVIVILTVDGKGRVSDYSVPNGKMSPDDMQEIGNLVFFTSFHPATAYGQPTSGRVLVTFHRINVRG